MHKSVLLIIATSFLSACAKLPPAPEVWVCAHDSKGTGFYCVNSKTKEEKVLSDNDESMHMAECMGLDDYKKVKSYIDVLKELAEKDCK